MQGDSSPPAAAYDPFLALEHQDPRGHRFHLAFGLLWCVLLTGPTVTAETGMIPLAVIWLLRLPRMWRWCFNIILAPASLLLLALVAWGALSLAWSPDAKVGLNQWGAARFGLAVLFLYPIAHHRRALIAALAVGFLLANVFQLLHALGLHLWERLPDRNTVWWDGAVAGSMLAAALGLHLPAALEGRGRTRLLALAGAGVSLLGVLATGTRGAWLASAGLIVLAVALSIARQRPRASALRRAGVALALAAFIAAGAWLTIGPSLQRRYEAGRDEIRLALCEGRYTTDTGARIAMARLAWRLWLEHPALGVGAGGYQHGAEAVLKREHIDPAQRRVHHHAHNALLHAAAVTGTPGALLLIAFFVAALNAAWRRGKQEGFGSYGAGPFYALLALALVSPFDPVHINSQTSALLMTLAALCPPALRLTPPRGP